MCVNSYNTSTHKFMNPLECNYKLTIYFLIKTYINSILLYLKKIATLNVDDKFDNVLNENIIDNKY